MRVSFLDGTIELMAPSYEHESRKSQIGWLLKLYLVEKDIDVFAHGSTTLQKSFKKAGKEPDESFCFYRQKKIPDLAIEVAITSGGIDTLEIYRRWAIPEVWIWQRDALQVFILEDEVYTKNRASRWFPDLDLKLLSECAKIESVLQARKKFLAGLAKS